MSGARFSVFASSAFGGLVLILLYGVLATGADAITRTVAQSFEAPQLFFFSGGIVAVLSWLMCRTTKEGKVTSLRSKRPRTLALRSMLFIAASVFYFFAFRSLPFAEVFVFIALVPIFAALLSGPILGEPVGWKSWIALSAGVAGMFLLYPDGLAELTFAHSSAALGALCGSAAMVLARHISRDDDNALLQVLYPNLALFLAMGCVLPFVYKPMGGLDMLLIASYASLLFFARWVLVVALTHMKAYVATLLMNLQFVVMIVVGAVVFAELPSLNLIIGASVIILAGIYLLIETSGFRLGQKRAATV
jgi:drug/metabolite transporter (DMT)-like permease